MMKSKMRKHSNSINGFILVELVVVLLIIVLLAAIILPKVVDEINIARSRAEIAETRTAMVGLQSIITFSYEDADRENGVKYFNNIDTYNIKLTEAGYEKIDKLTDEDVGKIENIILGIGDSSVQSFRYTTQRGSTVLYINGSYTVEKLYKVI
ncbi:MAG: hypothetical protein LBN34_05535 [Clostridiales Family XIII bacterium]|jgi:type II secretory pathway pseudopilin PulG|nr:hypothetical protein [Clostridiales Family XIII bacterium]